MSCILSIIIPSYNCEPYLKNALASLQHQAASNVEIIVVNDGSTDGTKAWLDTYAKKYTFIKIIHTENNGVSAARNRGLRMAAGKYITFLDSDDQLYPNSLKEVIAYVTDNDLDICYLKFDLVYPNGELLKNVKNIGEEGIVKKGVLHKRRTLPPTVYLRRIIVEHNITFPENMTFGEDSVFNFKAQYFAQKVSSFNLPYYKYTQLPNSLSKQGFSNKSYKSLISGIMHIHNFEQTVKPTANEYILYFNNIYENIVTRILELNILPTLDAHNYKQLKSTLTQIDKIGLMQLQDAKYPYFSKSFGRFSRYQKLLRLKSTLYKIIKQLVSKLYILKINNTIYLYWFNEKKLPNFGDVLNPWLIERITDNPIKFAPLDKMGNKKWMAIKVLFKKMIEGKLNLKNIHDQPEIFDLLNRPITIAIGSIIGWYSYKNVTVWGSGIMYSNDNIKPANFLAVRGEKTKKRLLELGYNQPLALGDPALLLNLVYKPQSLNSKKYKIGIIPHYHHYNLLQKYNNEEILVINLSDPIETVLEQIASCSLVLSTSLHGIIVSHVYEVPSLWATFEETASIKISGDNIKFFDYFSSVGIEEYNCASILKTNLENIDTLLQEIKVKYDKVLTIDSIVLQKLQKNLLEVAPFPIKKEIYDKVTTT